MSHVVRAAHADDLDSIYNIAKHTGGGFTNLPPDRGFLRTKLELVTASFQRDKAAANDQFLFVLEDAASGKVVGTCQIFARVGSNSPFYSYRIDRLSQFSHSLKRMFHTDTLTLCADLNGAGEVGGLFLYPEARATGLGKLLARSRYLFIKSHRTRFPDLIIAELRGIQDELGNSPFWEGLAGRFIDMTFRDADDFTAVHGTDFIAEVLPEHPIYPVLLDEGARTAIGLPHHSGRAAMRMLEMENFVFKNYIDVFDGGPTLMVHTDSIRTIMEARQFTIADVYEIDGARLLLAAGQGAKFRACYGAVAETGEGVVIAPKSAQQLGTTTGETVLRAGD